MNAVLSLAIAGWIGCGVLAYGMSMAFWQRRFVLIAPSQRLTDTIMSFLSGILGPIGLISICIAAGFQYGLMFRPFSKEEWLKAAGKKYPEFYGTLEEDWDRNETEGN